MDDESNSNNLGLPARRGNYSGLVPQSDTDRPPTLDEAKAELLACLTTVAPTGMKAQERAVWVEITAKLVISDLTLGQLREGCRHAMRKCEFPSQIIPAIYGSTDEPRRQYISDSGFVYRGDDTEVMRVAEQRADWNTYWSAKANRDRSRRTGNEAAPRLGYAAPIGGLLNSAIDKADWEDEQ